MGHHDIRVEISADRPEIGRIMLPIPPDTSKLFPKNFGSVCSSSFRRTPKNRVFAPRAQNHTCGQSVAFVVFVAFWGTTMLFFKKFKISAFRKVYGLWGYFQPLKSYITLKFRWGTVTHLWTRVSCMKISNSAQKYYSLSLNVFTISNARNFCQNYHMTV